MIVNVISDLYSAVRDKGSDVLTTENHADTKWFKN